MTPIPELRQQLELAVTGGILDPRDADEVAESIHYVGVLCERAIITRRLADHLINTLADRKAAEYLAKGRPVRWTAH